MPCKGSSETGLTRDGTTFFIVSSLSLPEALLEVFLKHFWRDVAASVCAVHGERAVVGALHVTQELDGSL